MRKEVERCRPDEGCGLVAGAGGQSVKEYPVENILHSPVRFRMDPAQQVKAMLEIESAGWELIAIYHSHPAGPAVPSLTDLREHADPQAAALIWTLKEGDWSSRAYILSPEGYRELRIAIPTGPASS